MTTAHRAAPPAALRRCPSDVHRHDGPQAVLDRLHEARGVPPGASARAPVQVAAMLGELERRRCAGGPLVVRTDTGAPDRLAPDEFFGQALAGLPEHDPADGAPPSLADVLDEMGIRTVEDLRSFRRLSVLHGALRAVHWTAVPAPDAPLAADALLLEIDEPARYWTP